MILLDYAFHESQTESPATLLGGVPGIENSLEVFSGYTFPRVRNFDKGKILLDRKSVV